MCALRAKDISDMLDVSLAYGVWHCYEVKILNVIEKQILFLRA
jgi:hypothetical protein